MTTTLLTAVIEIYVSWIIELSVDSTVNVSDPLTMKFFDALVALGSAGVSSSEGQASGNNHTTISARLRPSLRIYTSH